jgi:hypothetical protein
MADDAKLSDLKAGTPSPSAPIKAASPAAGDPNAVASEIGKAIADHLVKGSGPVTATPDMNKTIAGGKYLNRLKKLVNADGHEINDDGELLHPEQVQVDPFGRRY